MKVRIQLIRDNGSIVINLEGNAVEQLTWCLESPNGSIITEDRQYLTGFDYIPTISDAFVEERRNDAA